jgi:hypothetical protein
MSLSAMRYLSCSHCLRETRHLVSTLRKVFPRLPGSAILSQQIPYACPECNHLGLFPVPKLLKFFDIPDYIRHPDGMVEFLVGLACEQEFCESQVLVFAPMDSDIDSAEAKVRIREWSRADFTCRQGHWATLVAGWFIPTPKRMTILNGMRRESSRRSLL